MLRMLSPRRSLASLSVTLLTLALALQPTAARPPRCRASGSHTDSSAAGPPSSPLSMASEAVPKPTDGGGESAAGPQSFSSPSISKVAPEPSVAAGTSAAAPLASSSDNGSAATAGPTVANGAQSYPQDCSCGYVLTQYGNAYFPLRLEQDFAQTASLPKEMVISKYGTGPASEEDKVTTCLSTSDNVRFANGEMQLVVPGAQTANGAESITGAEIDLEDVTGGLFTMTAKIPSVEGTVASIFTFRSDESNGGLEEQDIEIVTASIDKRAANGGPPGVQLTNHAPDGTTDATTIPFPQDPREDFHNYTIFWPGTSDGQTKYLLDNKLLGGPTKYTSQKPATIMINNWSNGDPGFTEGPPKEDSVLSVRSVAFYYKTTNQPGDPSKLDCACRV